MKEYTGTAFLVEPPPRLNADEVPEREYKSLARSVLALAGTVREEDPDFRLWKTDREAWEQKRKGGTKWEEK